ncbi:DUF6161 domain-containing protein [Neobacillus pocheonensis]|uniref:DUF6161 domain-containing protein n=1 Tax=Neobacillus pocheonensis TaxID=363869 RepID=UPI003D2AC5D2
MTEATIGFSEELKAHFKELKLEFLLYPETRVKKFKSLDIFYKFICKESDFWGDCNQGSVGGIRSHIYQIKTNLDNAMNHNDINNAKNFLNSAINLVRNNAYPVVFSMTEIGRQTKKLYEISPNRAEGFISYLMPKQGYPPMNGVNFNDKEMLTGVFYGFVLENPEVSKALTEDEIDARQGSIDSLQELVNQTMAEISDETQRVKELSEVETTKIQAVQTTFKTETDKLLTDAEVKIKELEDLYTEKLRLSAPAEYWKTTKSSYQKTGLIWTGLAILVTAAFLGVISNLIFKIEKQESVLKAVKTVNFDTLKFGILITVFISVGIFLVNFLIKLAISAFHLSRDANERLQLTHLYLALLNEKGVTTEERSIVLQSLFSRADTGLLKGDSSPTIPDNGLVGQLLKVSGK